MEASSTWEELTDERTVISLLNNIRVYVERHCAKVRQSELIHGGIRDHVAVRINGYRNGRYATAVRATYTNGKWKVSNNVIQWVADDRRRKATEAERKRQGEELKREQEAKSRALAEKVQGSRRVFNEFTGRAQVVLWPNISDLRANPFVFRDKVIGIVTNFDTMIAENEAIFTVGGPINVVDIPTTRFQRAGATVLLAANVAGLKQIEMLGAKYTVPSLEYLDAYLCKSNDCKDVLLWAEQPGEVFAGITGGGVKAAADSLRQVGKKRQKIAVHKVAEVQKTAPAMVVAKLKKNKAPAVRRSSSKVNNKAVSQAVWVVQIGLYSALANARKVVVDLRKRGYPVVSMLAKFGKRTVTRLWVGPYGMRSSAVRIRKKIIAIARYKHSFITLNPLSGK
ncbi:MAG TPA: hypothetical protein ENI62_15690 [Gammaproteobacteria bacterium]|nr:hypothetical protein [Gammaproteobacteria bacterium]